MRARLTLLAGRPRAPFVAALVGVVLLLPTLGAGLFADDVTHRLLLSPSFELPGGPRGAWDLFRFVGPDRAAFHRALEMGFWPWWSAPNLRVGFFRPLTALSHALDYGALGGVPWVLHAESLALYALVVLAAAALYRRLVAPAWVATLAALAFSIDDAHSLTVVWVANRNALFAGVFGFAAVVAHDRARRDGERVAALAGPLLFAAGLLGGEAAVATLAYLAAHALWLDDAPLRRRGGGGGGGGLHRALQGARVRRDRQRLLPRPRHRARRVRRRSRHAAAHAPARGALPAARGPVADPPA